MCGRRASAPIPTSGAGFETNERDEVQVFRFEQFHNGAMLGFGRFRQALRK
jgi:hypothetical protein